MMLSSVAERDRVLRAYIVGRSWDTNPEFVLIRDLVVAAEPVAGCAMLYDYEWEVEPGRSNGGCGDLVLTDGLGKFVVVEAKYIPVDRSGHTTRVKRTKNRGGVRKQAEAYAGHLARRLGAEAREVIAYALTNERERLELVCALRRDPGTGSYGTSHSTTGAFTAEGAKT